jgi:Holliday junction resolvase RusA-like endonuclease
MEDINIYIPVKPEPKGRPKFFARRDPATQRMHFGSQTPTKTKATEQAIKSFMLGWAESHKEELQAKLIPWEGPVLLRVCFCLARPRSMKKRLVPVSRPDLDNYLKLVCDALNGVLWIDDSQIFRCIVEKVYDASPESTLVRNPAIGIYVFASQAMTPKENDQRRCTLIRGRVKESFIKRSKTTRGYASHQGVTKG